jgi:hypothetical protein
LKYKKSFIWSKTPLILSALLLNPVFLSSALASSDGSKTSDQPCSNCHSGGAGDAIFSILGPATVAPDSDNTYTLTLSGGPGVVGGLDVWVPDGGTLSAIDLVLTQIVSGEVTQTEPKPFLSGSVSWDFDWRAPSVEGFYSLMAQGVSANDGQGNGGDVAGTTSFNVQVAAIPIPASAFLFGSALGLMGWMRRKTK